MKISIIIPAYNEEKRIGKTLEDYTKFLKNQKINFEILVIINNTTDNTEKIVKEFSKKSKEVMYLNLKKGGKGFAVIEGFKDALKRDNNLIGFVDADNATPVKAYFDLVENLKDNDGIIASRWIKKSIIHNRTLKRDIMSWGFIFVVRSLFLMPFKDTQCGAKLFKREVIKAILPEIKISQWAFDVNLLYAAYKKGFKIKEYPTEWYDIGGGSINGIQTSVRMFLAIIRLRFIYSPFVKFTKILRPLVSVFYKVTK
ncbi:MAG: glycosyltransferase [archaeon]